MKRFVLLAVMLAAFGVVASASGKEIPRYQTQEATLTATVNGTYVHVYDIVISPCDNSFTGTGGIESLGLDETISGTIDDNTSISFQAEYITYNPGYDWSYDGPLSGGTGEDSTGQTFAVVLSLDLGDKSEWKNHGEFVSQNGGGSDNAHSCIGMPIH